MVKKIIHIADLHIRTIQLHELYKEQFEKLLKEIGSKFLEWTDEGISHNEIRIVIAGDIAHQKINISNEQLLLTSWFLRELTRFGKVVIIHCRITPPVICYNTNQSRCASCPRIERII